MDGRQALLVSRMFFIQLTDDQYNSVCSYLGKQGVKLQTQEKELEHWVGDGYDLTFRYSSDLVGWRPQKEQSYCPEWTLALLEDLVSKLESTKMETESLHNEGAPAYLMEEKAHQLEALLSRPIPSSHGIAEVEEAIERWELAVKEAKLYLEVVEFCILERCLSSSSV